MKTENTNRKMTKTSQSIVTKITLSLARQTTMITMEKKIAKGSLGERNNEQEL